jgi:hypothetical protein
MPRWAKVLLIVSIVSYVVLTAAYMTLYVKSMRRMEPRDEPSAAQRVEEWRVLIEEARAFGKGKTAEACIAESLHRLRRYDTAVADFRARGFLDHCLATATVPPETCTGVPPGSERWRSFRWQYQECSRRGWPRSQRCMQVMGGVQTYCDQR